jgi:light-regulated signal transduction histidine kinase (bacteriophytochrome)
LALPEFGIIALLVSSHIQRHGVVLVAQRPASSECWIAKMSMKIATLLEPVPSGLTTYKNTGRDPTVPFHVAPDGL